MGLCVPNYISFERGVLERNTDNPPVAYILHRILDNSYWSQQL
jgi:hypothetical protein